MLKVLPVAARALAGTNRGGAYGAANKWEASLPDVW